MSIHPNQHPLDSPDQPQSAVEPGPVGVQIPRAMILPALERLITTGSPRTGAQRLARNAKAHGIDLDLVWGVLGDVSKGQPPVRQTCMIVPGAGGTGMCFVSNPSSNLSPNNGLGDLSTQTQEIGSALYAAISGLRATAGDRIRIAQMLFEPKQKWTHQACQLAGMTSVGTLDYLRLDYRQISRWPASESLPEGCTLRPLNNLSMNSPTSDGSLLANALESSYEGTLDCPELCGMRPMSDVIASHQSTGVFDPTRWWILIKNDRPVGCCLLSHCPANESVELVYLGISPEVQGMGLGTKILTTALQALRINDEVREVTCAVDRRNTPASNVYLRLGFKRFDARCGYVRAV